MKKKIILSAFLVIPFLSVSAQVGIGTETPNAALEIKSSNSGILIPRISLVNLNSASPVVNPNTNTNTLEKGTMVFNTNSSLGEGFYYWDLTKWVAIQGGSTNTDKNTLDQAYDQGGQGAGRIINSDSEAVTIYNNNAQDVGLLLINNSTTIGVGAQQVLTHLPDQIGIATTMEDTATGVGYYVDDFSITNPYSAIQVTSYSNNDAYAGIKSTSYSNADAMRAVNEGDGIAFRAETEGNGSAIYAFSTGSNPTVNVVGNTNIPNVLKVENQRTNGGAAIDANGAIAIRATSNVAGGSGVSSYFIGTSGASGNFNATGNTPVGIRSLGSNAIRAGIGAKGNSIGSYGEFTLPTGSAFSGYGTSFINVLTYFCAVVQGSYHDAFRKTANTSNNTYFANVIGSGSNVTTVEHKNKTHVMAAVSAPQDVFQDYGVANLVNGKAIIKLDPILANNIQVDANNPLKIFVQLEGECNGVYVTNKSAKGFEVVELNNGTSNTPFSYTLIATRKAQTLNAVTGEQVIVDYSDKYRTVDLKPNVATINDNLEGSGKTELVKKSENKLLKQVSKSIDVTNYK